MTLDSPRRPLRFHAARPLLRSLTAGLLLVAAACGGGSHTTGPSVPATYTIGGSVSGLPSGATGLVLADGSTTLTVAGGATTFVFPTAVASGTAYTVTVQTSPAGLMCSVASGSGTVATANVANIVVTCSDSSYTIGGSVTGLNTSGLVLQNGSDMVTVPASATSYTLPTPVAYTSSYAVSVKTQPPGVNCTVANGSGTMPAANVTNVNVSCSVQPFTVGGTISGLTATGLTLANGSDTINVAANATTFTFPTAVNFGATYAVTASTQPAGLTCTVTNGSGSMGAGNVTNVSVTCANQAFSLGGTVTGLTTAGLVLANGSDTVTVASGSSNFTLPTAVAYTSPYSVTVHTQPTGLTCSVTSASGNMPAHNVTSVTVTCAANSYTVGGTISGLHGSGLVLANSTDLLGVASNATTFTMQHGVAYGATYAVTVHTQPQGYTCTIASGSGTMSAGNVTDVAVTCTQNAVFAYSADYNNGFILRYTYDNSTHELGTSQAASYASGNTPVRVRVNAAGTVLYVADTYGAGTITWYHIDPSTGDLTSFGSLNTGGFNPTDIVLNAAGTFAFVPVSGDDMIAVYTVNNDGSLTEIADSPYLLPNSQNDTTIPRDVDIVRGLVLHPTLPVLYAALQGDNSIITMSINPATGQLTQVGNLLPSNGGPYALTINSAGTFAYGVNRYASGVIQYSIDQTTGELTPGATIPTSGSNPFDVAIDPTGKFLYAVNNDSINNAVDEYSIDATTGALSQVGSAATALYASTILIDSTGVVYVVNNGDAAHSISTFSADSTTGVLTSIGNSTSPGGSALNSLALAKP